MDLIPIFSHSQVSPEVPSVAKAVRAERAEDSSSHEASTHDKQPEHGHESASEREAKAKEESASSTEEEGMERLFVCFGFRLFLFLKLFFN
jgi:hypothetical protein